MSADDDPGQPSTTRDGGGSQQNPPTPLGPRSGSRTAESGSGESSAVRPLDDLLHELRHAAGPSPIRTVESPAPMNPLPDSVAIPSSQSLLPILETLIFSPDSVVVFDTDIGYDLDDIIALWCAARLVGDHRLVVVTSDETRDRRARLARYFLDLIGRPDALVIAGRDLGGHHRFLLDDRYLSMDRPVSTDVIEVITHLCHTATAPLVWVGLGPLSNLSDALAARPYLTEMIDVTWMGGWLDRYRRPDRASHNFRMDPLATGHVLRAAHRPRCVLSTHTDHPALELTPASPLLAWSSTPGRPEWAQLIAAHADAWFAYCRTRGAKPRSCQADPLTLAAALGAPVVEFGTETVTIADDARLYRRGRGLNLTVSTHVDYPRFGQWLANALPETGLHPAIPITTPSPPTQ